MINTGEIMRVIVEGKVAKYINKTNEPDKSRLRKAIVKLGNVPPEGDIRPLTGTKSHRLRVGDYRLLLDIGDSKIRIFAIARRGQIYKEGCKYVGITART
jgi:mRNA-degrading endonuclease RelE of RelBE toxin-antitoxin system